MTPTHRRYFATEMVVAAMINAVLSIAFGFLVFGGRAAAPVAGLGGVAADALPQSFMIALMSCLVPTLLTRRRMAAGTVAPMPARWGFPRGLVARALLIAVPVAIVATALQLVLLPALAPSGTSPRSCCSRASTAPHLAHA